MNPGTITFTVTPPGEGDFPVRIRDTSAPPIVRSSVALLPWNKECPDINDGDWLVGLRATQPDDLYRVLAQFPRRCRAFDAIGYNLSRDRWQGVFIWLQDMQGITHPLDAYLKAEKAIPELAKLSRLVIHTFGEIEIAHEMATLDLVRMQAINVMNVGCRYSNTVTMRVSRKKLWMPIWPRHRAKTIHRHHGSNMR